MPLTKLDDIPALVLIDLQKRIVALPTAHPTGQVIANAAKLARAFRARQWPVVLVHVTGGAPGRTDVVRPTGARPADWAELVGELEQQPGDHVIAKQRWGAFIGTELDAYLREHKVTQIVLGGVATSIGVESTARSAFDHGYNVVLVSDAMTDMNADAHRHSVEKIFPRMGEVDVTENILKMTAG